MRADIAERRRTEQRVGNRMQEYIRIAVPEQSLLVGNFNAPEDKRALRNQAVYIITLSDSHFFSSINQQRKRIRRLTQRSVSSFLPPSPSPSACNGSASSRKRRNSRQRYTRTPA